MDLTHLIQFVVTIVSTILGMAGVYFTLEKRVSILERELQMQNKEFEKIEEQFTKMDARLEAILKSVQEIQLKLASNQNK